ncbi:MAG: MarR family transcriptional regulator [Chloroflexi bacterium]|nr:MarR family transcriptional regulator [Chloroflexota bacterium]
MMDKARELAASIVHRYLLLSRYQHRFGHLLRKQYNITGQQLAVLRYLMQGAPRTVSEISEFLLISDATASPLLERMERDGFVRRYRSSEDNRKVLVEPTIKGQEIVAQAPMGAIACMRAHLPELPLEELERIDWALARLSEIARVDERLLHCEGDSE